MATTTTTTTTTRPKEQINLLRGWPSPSLLPASLLKSAANAVLSDPTISGPALSYGPELGFEPLRSNIAAWLTDFFRPTAPIAEERICITGGASQNLGCMLNVYTDPEYTRRIWIVAPAYFLAFRIFEDAGFGVGGRMRAVPEDEEGVDIEFLRREIKKSEEEDAEVGVERPRYKPSRKRAKVYKHVIYCVPTFANPSSRTMSLARRKELVRVARDYDALVVSDDVYDFLQWPADYHGDQTSNVSMNQLKTDDVQRAHLPRIVDIDRAIDGGSEREGADGFGNAISNGSFSKIAGPGIRVGWLEGTEKFAYGVSQAGITCSGGAPSQLTSTYVNHLLATNTLQTYIHTVLRPAYSTRYRALMRAIKTHLLPLGFTLPQTDRDVIGGYFTWLTLPSALKISAKALAKRCIAEENVIIAGGNIFEVPGEGGKEVRFDRNVRLCWSYVDEWKLEEGVERVGNLVRRVLEEGEEDESGEFVVVESEDGDELVDDFK